MSIKTSELQQLQSILGTDSLLADTAAAGTGRLSLARAAEFFGAELVKPANPVGAALSNKAALSAQQTVEKAAETWSSKEVAAAELPAYIDSLPRLLTTNLIITVSSGNVPGNLAIKGFYGTGSLTIQVAEGAEVVCQGSVTALNCGLYVDLKGLKLYSANGIAANASIVTARNCSVNRTETENSSTGAYACHGGALTLYDCALHGYTYALNAQSCGIITAHNCTGSENIYGTMVVMGGIVLLSGTTPDLMGGNANTKGGGIIAKANGTLL